MRKVFKLFLPVALSLNISACTYYIVSFEDVSNEAPYSTVVGLSFKTNSELLISGYNSESIPGKEIQKYQISPPPVANTRFVLSQNKILSGTSLTIIAVMRCTDCFFDFKPRIEIKVKTDSFSNSGNAPIFIDDTLLIKNWGLDGDEVKYNNNYLIQTQ